MRNEVGPSASMIRSTPSPPVRRVDLGLEVLVAVVDRVGNALGADRIVLGGRGGAEDLGAGVAGDLGGGDADAAGRGVDQDAVALAQAAHQDQRRVGGAVVDREGGALLEAEPLGQRQRLIGGDGDELGLAAEAGAGDDAVADRERSTPSPTDSTCPATS